MVTSFTMNHAAAPAAQDAVNVPLIPFAAGNTIDDAIQGLRIAIERANFAIEQLNNLRGQVEAIEADYLTSAYTGSANIVTVGVLTSGTWNADVIALEYGGLGADASGYDGLVKVTGGASSAVTVTGFAETILDDADAGTVATTIGLGTGNTVRFTAVALNMAPFSNHAIVAKQTSNTEGIYLLSTDSVYAATMYQKTNGQFVFGSTGSINLSAPWVYYSATAGDVTVTASNGDFVLSNCGVKINTDNEKLTLGASGAADSYLTFNGTGLEAYDAVAGALTLSQLKEGTTSIVTLGTITTGTWNADVIAHEYGGLEDDVSGYDGLVKISGGSTSAVTITSAAEGFLGNGTFVDEVAIQSGYTGLVLGADINALTLTDNTNKVGRLAVPHYDIQQYPVAIFGTFNDSTSNTVYIGGGSSITTCATAIEFRTAGDNVTTGGTTRLAINSAGSVYLPHNNEKLGFGDNGVSDSYILFNGTSWTVWDVTSGALTLAQLKAGTTSLVTLGTVTTGTWQGSVIDHERGGLEADVSAYSGLIKISGGSTSQAVAGTDYAAASHNHAASEITSGTLVHERGGLETDVSAFNNDWPFIQSGSTYRMYSRYSLEYTYVAPRYALQLVNDSSSPGNNKVYGTNGSGTRGWHDDLLQGIGLGSANQVLGMNSAGTALEWKTITPTSNRVTVTHGSGTITLSAPQDLHTSAYFQVDRLGVGTSYQATSGTIRLDDSIIFA